MNKKIISLFLTLFLLSIISMGFKGKDDNKTIRKPSVNDEYKYIAINAILMWVSNNGDGSHDPRTDGNGFYWPGGENAVKSAIFEDGLIFGGKIGREVRVNGNTHRQGLQAGKILDDGTPDNPGLDKYRIYKIRKGWELLPPGPERDELEADYNEWPVEDGAPWVDVDGDGVFTRGVDEPEFIGDEVLWYVANDMDPARSTFTYGTLPMGLEFQTTIFGFKRTGALGDMVFKKYKIINKGNNLIKDMIVAYWSDTDLGDANDDYTGCDTTLSLGYTYNADNQDGDGSGNSYGTPPPSVGYDFFQGPIVEASAEDSAKFDGRWIHGYKNLPMTAFIFYINGNATYRDPAQGDPAGSVEFYNYLQGKVWNGNPFYDPNTNEAVNYVLAGDPVAGTGWNEVNGWPNSPTGGPGDRRHVMASGPFNMAPGDTQEVVVGIVIAQGTDNLNSVTALKQKDDAAQIAYDLDFQLTPPPDAPTVHTVSGDRSITLWWENNSESYDEGDPLIYNHGYEDTTYTFEGYRVWQFKDLSGTDPVLIGIYDVDNDVEIIYEYQTINGEDVLVPVIKGPNEGLRRTFNITTDAYTNGPLYNGNPYYFGVTAYGYSPNSSPTYLENPAVIQEVFPGTPSIEVTTPYDLGSHITMEQTSGGSDASVIMKVIDPYALTGDEYEVVFTGAEDSLVYTWIDVTTGDTLLKDQTNYITLEEDAVSGNYFVPAQDTMGNRVIDGLMLLVQNVGKDSISTGTTPYKIKSIVEAKGPGGTELSEPVDVEAEYVDGAWEPKLNSTGEWTIKQKGTNRTLIFDNKISIGYDDYELRFSGESGYYLSGYARGFTPLTKSDTLASGTLPFTVWDVGREAGTADDYQLATKVLDNDRFTEGRAIPDHTWSQFPDGDWEELYVFEADYASGPLPELSGDTDLEVFKFGSFVLSGEIPAEGTVIRINTYKPLTAGDVFKGRAVSANIADKASATENLDNISVFPNPYFGANPLERDKYQRFVRFTNLPREATIRIYSLSGVFIQRIDKDNSNQYVDWDLRNRDGLPVASGVYLAYLDMPGVGTKIMKLAVVMEQQYIDRL